MATPRDQMTDALLDVHYMCVYSNENQSSADSHTFLYQRLFFSCSFSLHRLSLWSVVFSGSAKIKWPQHLSLRVDPSTRVLSRNIRCQLGIWSITVVADSVWSNTRHNWLWWRTQIDVFFKHVLLSGTQAENRVHGNENEVEDYCLQLRSPCHRYRRQINLRERGDRPFLLSSRKIKAFGATAVPIVLF